MALGLSCKKYTGAVPDQNQDLNSSKNRLSFIKSDFDKLYQKLRKTDNKQELKDFVELKSLKPEFISLSISNLDNKISQTATSLIENKLTLQKGLSLDNKAQFGGNGKLSVYGGEPDVPTTDPPTYDEVVEELVDDVAFATLLNEDGEIQVDNIIYKVTPFGTFFASVGNEIELENVFNNVYVQNDYTLRLYDPATPIELDSISVTGTAYNDVKLLNQKVYFVDSFIEDGSLQPSEITPYLSDTILDPLIYPTNGTTSNPPPSTPANNEPLENLQQNILGVEPILSSPQSTDNAYQNMLEFPIEFRKGFLGLGSLLQTFFTNSTRYNNFDNKHRISALMYNRNYGILKTIGIKIKFQKKGWLWWNAEKTQEIRAGWDYVAYKSPRSVDRITLPSNDIPPSNGSPYLINPTLNPLYGVPMYSNNNNYAKRYNLYGFYIKQGSNELFTITIPGGLVPFKPDGLDLPSSKFKDAIYTGWNALKKILRKSAPPSGVSLLNNDPDNFKFPVYTLNKEGGIKYLSINDMENMPKNYSSTILRTDQLKDSKISTFISPYETKTYNNDIIDIPFDASSVDIKISTDPNNWAISLSQVATSLLTEELGTSYDVEGASIFGAVKYNNQWKGIRLKVKMKD